MKKYKGKTVAWLLKRTQYYFNQYIRLRDAGNNCISCGSTNTAHASHLYSVKSYPTMRFVEDNVHLSCAYCNTFLEGNLMEYIKWLPGKIGQERVDELRRLADLDKQMSHKWNRIELIELLEEYKQKCKE